MMINNWFSLLKPLTGVGLVLVVGAVEAMPSMLPNHFQPAYMPATVSNPMATFRPPGYFSPVNPMYAPRYSPQRQYRQIGRMPAPQARGFSQPRFTQPGYRQNYGRFQPMGYQRPPPSYNWSVPGYAMNRPWQGNPGYGYQNGRPGQWGMAPQAAYMPPQNRWNRGYPYPPVRPAMEGFSRQQVRNTRPQRWVNPMQFRQVSQYPHYRFRPLNQPRFVPPRAMARTNYGPQRMPQQGAAPVYHFRPLPAGPGFRNVARQQMPQTGLSATRYPVNRGQVRAPVYRFRPDQRFSKNSFRPTQPQFQPRQSVGSGERSTQPGVWGWRPTQQSGSNGYSPVGKADYQREHQETESTSWIRRKPHRYAYQYKP